MAASPGSSGDGSACAGGTPVIPVVAGLPRPGVGSNDTHPMPENSTSGQACALRPYTAKVPGESATASPVVKPTTTLAGSPTERAASANAVENCWQKPLRCSTKAANGSGDEE